MRRNVLQFLVHQFDLKGRSYLLLPKLNSIQIGVVKTRLVGLGFKVAGGNPLRARLGGLRIAIYPAGYSFSDFDPSDVLLPLIPDLLASPLETVGEDQSLLQYAQTGARRGRAFRASTRIEHGRTWTWLRETGECGLAPDERSVIQALLRRCTGKCTFVTDFPTDEGRPLRLGRRIYYESYLDPSTACSTLAVAGERKPRNAYLPRDGMVRVGNMVPLTRQAWDAVFADIGQWCYLRPGRRERSN